MEYKVKEKQLENPTPSATSTTPNNLYPQKLSSNYGREASFDTSNRNCHMYEIFKEFVSNNRDMTRVLLNEVDKPMKYIDFQYEGMRSGLYDLKVFVTLEYYMWFEIVIDSKKCIILKTRYCTRFKYEKFVNDIENRILRIMFKTSKPIYKNSIKISFA